MIRAACFILLLAAALFSRVREMGEARQRGRERVSYAFFEAFPADGRGTNGVCSTTAPTGAKGEALTFTRATNATCTKTASGGLATTGIANGDLVVLSSGQPRVPYESASVLGLQVEPQRTNSIIRSQELDISWSTAAGGSPNPGAPTVTPNAAVAPDGTTTAERIDFGSTTGTGFGVVYNTAGRTSTAASWSHSLYIKGVSGSGTIYLMSVTGSTYNSTACAFVSTSWSRCAFTGTETVATWYTQIGFDLRDGAQSGQGAQSIYAWGVQGEAGAYATSYIPTTTAALSRSADTNPTFASVTLAPVATSGCSAISVTPASASIGAGGLLFMNGSGRPMYLNSFTLRIWDGTSEPSVAPNFVANTSKRYRSTWSGATKAIYNVTDSLSGSDAFDGTMDTTGPLWVGASTGIGLNASWIVSRVQLDPTSTRCQ